MKGACEEKEYEVATLVFTYVIIDQWILSEMSKDWCL